MWVRENEMPTPWMRFVIRASIGERFIAFSEEIGANSMSEALDALLQAWGEVTRAEVKSDA